MQLMARVFAIWLFACLLLTLVFAVFIAMLPASAGFASDSLRWVLMPIAYALYYLLLIALTVYASVCFRQSSSGLAIMLAAWLLWSLFLPSTFAALAKQRYPLPSNRAFEKGMDEDRSKGIDGHNPEADRKKALEQKVLAEYNVKVLDSLPVNFDGIVMQADEEYGNTVWDKHFTALDSIYQAQNGLISQSVWINPFQSLQSLSTSLAGTDLLHYQHFLRAAEAYRRVLIKTLNDKLTFGGSKTGDWGYKADASFFQSVNTFDYDQPQWSSLDTNGLYNLIFLLTWAVFPVLLILFGPIPYREY
jgi:ABC-2 type transport system permease protein